MADSQDTNSLPTIRSVSALTTDANLTADGAHDASEFDAEDTRLDMRTMTPDVTDANELVPPAAEDDPTHRSAAEPEDQTQLLQGDSDWDLDDWDAYWDRVVAIEAAGDESEEAMAATLQRYGLRDRAHFDEMCSAFQSRFGDDPAFAQAGVDARARGTTR